MILNLGGHIGASVSALVDGQLSPAEEERAWSHILTCPGCRRLVEREGWVKSRVAGLSFAPVEGDAPRPVLGSLYDVEAWAAVDRLEDRARTRRRTGLALVGAGSVGAAVFGFASLSGATLGIGGGAGDVPPTTRISGPSSPAATPTPVSDGRRRAR